MDGNTAVRQVRFVMKGGKVYKNLAHSIWPDSSFLPEDLRTLSLLPVATFAGWGLYGWQVRRSSPLILHGKKGGEFVLKRNLLAISVVTVMILTSGAPAQQAASSDQSKVDQEIDLLRKDIRSEKKQLIAANLQLTDTEATKFWPIYDQYTAELVKINDAKYAALKEYAANYSTLTDDKALSLGRQILGVDESVAQLRLKYVPIVNKVIPGKKTALFFQLDRRLVMMIDLQVAAEIPIVQQ